MCVVGKRKASPRKVLSERCKVLGRGGKERSGEVRVLERIGTCGIAAIISGRVRRRRCALTDGQRRRVEVC